MIKKFLFIVLIVVSAKIYSQQGTASPYSFYGIGDLKFRGTVENRSMAGLSMFTDSIHMNLQNPSGYGRLKLTNYAAGGSQKFTTFDSNSASEEGSTTTLDYLALAFPIGSKMGGGFGLLPFYFFSSLCNFL